MLSCSGDLKRLGQLLGQASILRISFFLFTFRINFLAPQILIKEKLFVLAERLSRSSLKICIQLHLGTS